MEQKKEENKKEQRKVTSIARRINWIRVGDVVGNYLTMDFIFIIAVCCVFMYGMDVQQTGKFSLDYSRDMLRGESLRAWIYQVSDGNRLLYRLHIGVWLVWFRNCGVIVLIIQFLNVVSIAVNGTAQMRRQLKPLDEIAEKAKELKALVEEENKYHNLEDAIAGLGGEVMESGIHMNDRELRGIEQALNELLDRIRETYRQQDQFVSDASHELRTPIAVILGYANMLDRWGKEDEKVLEEAIEAIQNEADHMQKLVEQLLFLARGDANRQSLDMKEQKLDNILQEIYEESCMIDPAHSYVLEKKEEALLWADYDMLKQSVRILVDNAVKYTPEGGEIILRVGCSGEGNPYYQIQDSGIGMSQKDAEHVFDRFYRADAVRSSKSGGTGLGLSIARWIIDKHRANCRILSVEGLGTRFYVEFPAYRKGAAE